VGVGVGVGVGVWVGKPEVTVNVGLGVFFEVLGFGVNVGDGGGTLPFAPMSCLVAIGSFGLPARYVSMNSFHVWPGRFAP
jgi:hypothetical protein